MTALAPTLSALNLGLPLDAPFTVAQAKACGVTPQKLARLTTAGVLRRILHGVYVASDVPESIELRCAALSLVVPLDAFVCDTTAAWVYRGPDVLPPNAHLAVPPISCFRPSGKHRLRNQLTASGERAVRAEDLSEIDSLLVTTPLRTALDLGRLQRSRDMRLWGMDAMLATQTFTHDELLMAVDRFAKQRGVRMLRALAPLADAHSQSFGESALRLRWYDAGLPRPRLQIPIEAEGVEVAYLDMGLEEWLFAAEYDGAQWHSETVDVEHDAARRGWLRTQRRWRIEVFRSEDTFGRAQGAEVRLRRAAAEARATYGSRTFIV